MNEPTAKRDADLTRARLLEVAAAQFARLGYEGCRNQSIADAARANKAMINYYFGGKLGLYRAVVVEALDAIAPMLVGFESTQGEPGDRLEEWIQVLANAFELRPYLPAILVREHLDGGQRLQDEYLSRVLRFFRITAAVLGDGDNQGALRAEDAHGVHLSLIGALSFFLISHPYREEAKRRGTNLVPAPSRDEYVAYLKRLFRSGLANP